MQSYATAETYTHMDPIIRRIVVWYHDESIFYANDRRLIIWVRLDADHKPIKKGEGQSLMVSDLISAEYGWLRSPDGYVMTMPSSYIFSDHLVDSGRSVHGCCFELE